ncbi:MAG: 30S ribosomal protein S8 [Planctomycetota bacterium]
MTMTDPIADMLTRIRNANAVGHKDVRIPYSRVKEGIVRVLAQEGFISSYEVVDAHLSRRKPLRDLRVTLRYGPDGEKVIRRIERVSKPGCRTYRGLPEATKVLGGLGIDIYSTSQGVLSDRECRERKVGGEILCTVW